MEPISSQLLPTNCRILVLVDVDGDGELKLVTGHADRVVHIHKLEAYNEPATPVQDEGRQLTLYLPRGSPLTSKIVWC